MLTVTTVEEVNFRYLAAGLHQWSLGFIAPKGCEGYVQTASGEQCGICYLEYLLGTVSPDSLATSLAEQWAMCSAVDSIGIPLENVHGIFEFAVRQLRQQSLRADQLLLLLCAVSSFLKTIPGMKTFDRSGSLTELPELDLVGEAFCGLKTVAEDADVVKGVRPVLWGLAHWLLKSRGSSANCLPIIMSSQIVDPDMTVLSMPHSSNVDQNQLEQCIRFATNTLLNGISVSSYGKVCEYFIECAQSHECMSALSQFVDKERSALCWPLDNNIRKLFVAKLKKVIDCSMSNTRMTCSRCISYELPCSFLRVCAIELLRLSKGRFQLEAQNYQQLVTDEIFLTSADVLEHFFQFAYPNSESVFLQVIDRRHDLAERLVLDEWIDIVRESGTDNALVAVLRRLERLQSILLKKGLWKKVLGKFESLSARSLGSWQNIFKLVHEVSNVSEEIQDCFLVAARSVIPSKIACQDLLSVAPRCVHMVVDNIAVHCFDMNTG